VSIGVRQVVDTNHDRCDTSIALWLEIMEQAFKLRTIFREVMNDSEVDLVYKQLFLDRVKFHFFLFAFIVTPFSFHSCALFQIVAH
jgi:hypothetical protein